MNKLILITCLFFSSFYASAQSRGNSKEPKSESIQKSTKGFSLADGRYVGVNPNTPQMKMLPRAGIKKVNNPKADKGAQQQRFNLDVGKDTGVGSEFRSERYRSLENRMKSQKALQEPSSKNDTTLSQRIVLQDGKYVGAGSKKPKDP